MSDSATIFLGIMAVSLAVMAVIHVGLIVAGIRAMQKLTAVADELRREVRPLLEKVNRIADDASRMTTLATLQVERVDQFIATAATRVDDTLSVLQGLMSGPVRQTAVIVTAFRAALSAFREWQRRKPRSRDLEDDDAWFVG